VNQKNPPAIDKALHPLGRFTFEKEAVVTIGNAGTDGYVIADAVQLVQPEIK
jgi:hypothetical protein